MSKKADNTATDNAEAAKNQLPVSYQDNPLLAGFDPSEIADMLEEKKGYERAGTSTDPNDYSTPFLVLLQDMSPEVKKRDSAYVEGAEPGFILNKTTKHLWSPAEGAEVIHCAFERMILEWVPREKGGGLVGRHVIEGTLEDTMAAIGGRKEPDPRDPTKMNWVNNKGNQLIDTRYHYLLVNEDGAWGAVLLPLSSTGHKTSREWMTDIKKPLPGLGEVPAWYKRYRLSSVSASNNKGEFFRLIATFAGLVGDKEIRNLGKAFYKAAIAGSVKKGDEGPTDSPESHEAF